MRKFRNALLMAGAAMVGLTTVTVSDAQAGGFAVREQSTELQGMSFAGAAAGSMGLSSMFFNPATITQHDGWNSDSNIAFIFSQSQAKNATSTIAGFSNSGNIGSGQLGSIAAVPASYYNYQLNEMIYLGLSMNSPYGLETESSAYVGGPHGFKSAIMNIIATPTIGLKLSDKLSVAGGIQVSYIDGRLTTAFPNTTVTLTELEGDDWGVGFTGGLTYDFSDYTTIGIGFRSEIDHTLKGSFFTAAIPLGMRAKADVTLPAQAHASVTHRLNDRLKVNASVEWTDWSTLQSLIIQTTPLGNLVQTFDWRDGWFFSLGGEYAVNEALTVRAGAAYEISPVRDANRGPRVPDNDRIWASLGGSYNWNDWLTLHGSYTHIFMKNGNVNLPATAVPPLPSLVATFKQHVNIVSVGASISW